MSPCLPWGRTFTTCIIAMLKNDRCKCIPCFLKNKQHDTGWYFSGCGVCVWNCGLSSHWTGILDPAGGSQVHWHEKWASCKYINSLWLSDIIWRHRSGSTLAQVLACCLAAPSHYLNQCWLKIINIHYSAVSQKGAPKCWPKLSF